MNRNIGSEINDYDDQYVPFPNVKDWSENISIDDLLWKKEKANFSQKRSNTDKKVWDNAVQTTLRMAAIDTGAIEELYNTDRGFTYSVAIEKVAWEAYSNPKEVDIKRFFEAQLNGYLLLYEAITETIPFSEAWIRELHKNICEPQEHYEVNTPAGKQMHQLPKGEYKKIPNHVVKSDGSIFAYAPVHDTPIEMQRLIDEINSDEFNNLHVVEKSAYVHYAFVRIHPFSDGNGRVARVLASFFLIRDVSLPLIILADQRNEYFNSLEKSDEGNYQKFTEFIFERAIETLQIQKEFLNFPSKKAPTKLADELDNLFIGIHGERHFEIDNMAYRYFDFVKDEFDLAFGRLSLPDEVRVRSEKVVNNYNRVKQDGYRPPLKQGGRILIINLESLPPAKASASMEYHLFVSQRERKEGEILLEKNKGVGGEISFKAQLKDIGPEISEAFRMRLEIWVDGVVSTLLEDLLTKATNNKLNPPS